VVAGGEQDLMATVNHPAHYNAGRIEVVDFLEDQRLGFHLGNAVKYITRAEHKGSAIEDLEKAAWYLQREIQRRRWPGLTSKQAQAREAKERKK